MADTTYGGGALPSRAATDHKVDGDRRIWWIDLRTGTGGSDRYSSGTEVGPLL